MLLLLRNSASWWTDNVVPQCHRMSKFTFISEFYFRLVRLFGDVLKKQYIICCVAVTDQSPIAKTSWQLSPNMLYQRKMEQYMKGVVLFIKNIFIDILL